MFSGLRTNSIFYVLDKSNEPKLQIRWKSTRLNSSHP